MIIRQARPEDASALFEVHQQSVNTFCAAAYSAAHMAEWFAGRTSEMYQPAIQAGSLWLAESSQGIVGFVEAVPGEVALLFVAPNASGQFIGSKLLEFAVRQSSGAGQRPVSVIATKNSVSFYRRHGFRQVGVQHFARGDPPLEYPVVKLVLEAQPNLSSQHTDA